MVEKHNATHLKYVNQPFQKIDARQLLLGKPVYLEDLVQNHPLVVELLRSPHANAIVDSIDTSEAKKVPGVVDVYTWEDVPQRRYTNAGQTYPEPSPYDRLIIDRHVRFVGDVVAIVAAETQEAAEKALRIIRVRYQVLEAVLDPAKSKDNPVLVHPEGDWKSMAEVGGDPKRNLVASHTEEYGNPDAVLAECDVQIDRVYRTKPYNQAMMETFRTYTELDTYGRLNVISSTQIMFHVRRILAHALGVPKSKVRVRKPRIGGGFGAKQTSVSEIYPAFVTMQTGRPAMIVYTREESMIAGSPRHPMTVHVRLGAMKDGTIRALDVFTLSNTGAYGEHGPTTVGLSGTKSISLYSGSLEAYRFGFDVVYTNLPAFGAYRGYGAPQGIFAVESAVNELADQLSIDPVAIREKNMVREGMYMPAYKETATACALDRCMARCSEIFGWKEKFPVRKMENGKIRAAGVAMAMQGSAITKVDVGSATVRLGDDGTYMLLHGAADMGTGSDTTLAQVLAESMPCSLDQIAVYGGDTDTSPYDSGSYASSTAYLTGKAVEEAAEILKGKIRQIGAELLGCMPEETAFDGTRVYTADGRSVTLADVATKSQVFTTVAAEGSATLSSPISPPPYMVGMVEIELDPETGEVSILDYKSVVDCGTPLNPALARVQAEGGIVQGIGHTLYEDVHFSAEGKQAENSFLQYRIPTRLDIGHLQVEFETSWEESGPYGAKSIGEVVINTPAPAIAHAIFRATGVWHREIPIRPEQIALGRAE